MAENLKRIESSEVTEEERERAELAVIADQFVNEGRLSLAQAEEISLISSVEDARDRFLEFVKERHEANRSNIADNSGHERMGEEGADKYLA